MDADDGGTLGTSAIPALAASDRVVRTAGAVTTTSTSLVDLTGASITFTTRARRVQLQFSAGVSNSGAGNDTHMNLDVDGANELGSDGPRMTTAAGGGYYQIMTLAHLTAVLTAASHTFKVRWKVNAGTGSVDAQSLSAYTFSAYEVS